MKFLITAGGTREYIDPVRFISNASSGKMGCALAQAALTKGHKVTLITTVDFPKLKTKNSRLKTVKVETTSEMFKAVKKYFPLYDCLIMAAAVADYTPVKKSKIKIKKSKMNLVLKLKPTIDILKWAGSQKLKTKNLKLKTKILVGFALEDKNLKASAEKKLKEKNLDMIIANKPDAIGLEKAELNIRTVTDRWQKLKSTTKQSAAKKIISMAEQLSALP
jgi:phosphopantothenoylcysteine synthetase/decarboxylase